jgi:hypothetical protein
VLDASPLAVEIAHKLTANPEFYNLPRKFKISVTGCPIWCSYPEINDVALTALKRTKNGREEIGYSLRVGGGLSTEPHIAVRLNAFVPQDKAYDAVKAVVRDLPRAGGAAREPHPCADQVPVYEAWLDRGVHAGGRRREDWASSSIRATRTDCRRCLSRPRGRSPAEAGGA